MSNDHRWYGRNQDDRGSQWERERDDHRHGGRGGSGDERDWRREHHAHSDHDHAWRPFGDTGPTNYDRGPERSGGPAERWGRSERYGGPAERSAWISDSDYGRGQDRDVGAGRMSEREGGFTETGGRYSDSFRREQDQYRGPRDHDQRGHERNWLEKAGEGVQSMFGAGQSGQHRGRGPKGYRRSDERIREDVSDRLSEDSWLDASEIEVAVQNGEVTLSGTVSSREDRRRAEDLAERVSGVDHVQNNLRASGGGSGA